MSDNSTQSINITLVEQPDPVVYIVDDIEQVQDVVRLILEKEGIKSATFNSGEDFLAQDEISEVGCLLLDNQMPGMKGLQVQAELLTRDNRIPIIFISGDSRYNEVADAVRDGAFYFLQKPFARTELLALVREAIDTSKTLSRRKQQSRQYKLLLEDLTAREHEVYQLVTEGRTNKAIADSLNISNGTVEFHRANMMKKLNAKSLADLMQISRNTADKG